MCTELVALSRDGTNRLTSRRIWVIDVHSLTVHTLYGHSANTHDTCTFNKNLLTYDFNKPSHIDAETLKDRIVLSKG